MPDLANLLSEFTDPVLFERLCCDFLALMGYEGIDPQGTGRKDGGKDAVLRHPTFGRIVFHFSLRVDWERKLEQDIKRVKSAGQTFDQFIFVTNRRITASKKDKLKSFCRNCIQCDLEIFDQERLRIVLSKEKDLCARYFPDYFVTGIVLDRLVASVEHLISNGLQVPKAERFRHTPRFLGESIAEVSNLLTTNLEEALQKAETITKTISALSKHAVEGLFLIGCLCYNNGEFGAAEELWGKGLRLNTTHFGLNFNLACLMEKNPKGIRYGVGFRAERAIELYEIGLTNTSNPEERADCLDNKGAVLFNLGRIEEAKECFIAAQIEFPEHFSSRHNLANVVDDWATAVDLYQSVFNSPVAGRAHINMANHYVKLGLWREAIVCIFQAKDRYQYIQTYILLAQIAYARRKYRKMRRYSECGLRRDIDNLQINFLLGKALLAEGNFNQALIAFERTIEISPESHEPYLAFADTLKAKAESCGEEGTPIFRETIDRAIPVLKKALELSPSTKNLHNRLGTAYLHLEMYASARLEFEKEISLDSNNAIPHFNLGLVAEYGTTGIRYASTANIENAIRHYREALTHDSCYVPALFNLGTNLLILGSYAEAVEVLTTASEISPVDDNVLTNRGIALWRNGQLKEAIDSLKRAIKINPHNQYARKAEHEIAHTTRILVTPELIPRF